MHSRKLLLSISSLSFIFRLGSSLQYPLSDHTIPLLPVLKEHETSGVFAAEVFIGNQLFQLTVDTGSSDTWVMAKNANCTDLTTLQPVPPAECGWSGPRYQPGTSFEDIPNVHLNTSYGNSVRVNGPLGYTELILGGLTIPRQEISAVSYLTAGGVPQGGNVSGILGLAHASLTNAFPGNDPSKDIICKGNSSCGPVPYPPVLDNLFQNGSVEPVLAFALSRGSRSGGVMTIGGIPRLNDPFVNASESTVASSPMKPLGNTTVPNVFTVQVDSFVYNNTSSNAGQGRYMVDSGTMPSTFPKEEAAAINALFDPPGTPFGPTYKVSCNATAPNLGISIGGRVFYHHPNDLILRAGDECYSAIAGSLSAGFVPILGASWMRNVLAIFDVGASEMTLMSRVYYEDS